MLKPAQLYKDRLEEENIKSWYRPEYMFYNGGTGDFTIELPDNTYESHCFVSIDADDSVIGYISYSVDWASMSASNFGIINYYRGDLKKSFVFLEDARKAIFDLFNVYHMNRIEWWCYADNPAIRGYRNFIKRYGGRECGYYRQVSKLQDGKLHDSVCFEILASEFIPPEKCGR